MPHSPVRQLSRCAMFTALLCVCAWISIPLPGITITMQTFGIFLALELLGGRLGTYTVLAYLLLGSIGLPVFSAFQGGIGVLLGPTGGYLWGFLLASLVYWIITHFFPGHTLAALLAGLLTCYACGTMWYAFLFLTGVNSILPAFLQCVLPYLLPDTLKLLLVRYLRRRLSNHFPAA